MTTTEPRFDYTREELIAICERSFVPEEKWRNRDSASAHRQLGECYALLKAGCDFGIIGRTPSSFLQTDAETIWVVVAYKGFGAFEYDGTPDDETFYLPTAERLNERDGQDWY